MKGKKNIRVSRMLPLIYMFRLSREAKRRTANQSKKTMACVGGRETANEGRKEGRGKPGIQSHVCPTVHNPSVTEDCNGQWTHQC
jgi:hypothetical protein